jgi:hypothetical protein
MYDRKRESRTPLGVLEELVQLPYVICLPCHHHFTSFVNECASLDASYMMARVLTGYPAFY